MPDLGPHAGFIWLSYTAAAVCIAGLIAWVWLDESAQRKRLQTLERRGIRRRSAKAGAAGRTGDADE